MDAVATALPNIISTLDTFRYMLEDLGGGRGSKLLIMTICAGLALRNFS